MNHCWQILWGVLLEASVVYHLGLTNFKTFVYIDPLLVMISEIAGLKRMV